MNRSLLKVMGLAGVILGSFFMEEASLATEFIREDSVPDLGIGVYDRNDIRWRSKAIAHPDRLTPADRIWSGRDLWESEYGAPLDFSSDLLTKYGYSSGAPYSVSNGTLKVTTGAQGFSFGFGGLPNDKEHAALLPGATWARNTKDQLRIQMVMEQDVPETRWRLSWVGPYGTEMFKEITIAGVGRHDFQDDVYIVRSVNSVWGKSTGWKLECLTPGATLLIDSIKIAPSSANVYYRKEFALGEKPIAAHASFNNSENYDLYVNGKAISSGTYLYPAGLERTVDLRPYLKVGLNTIAFRKDFLTWAGESEKRFLFEGVSVARSGRVTRFLTDDSWKTSYHATEGWNRAGYDDSNWKAAQILADRDAPYMTTMWDKDGTAVPNGIDPKHMDALEVAPFGHQYPLFDDTEKVAFQVRLPSGMQGFKVTAEIYKAETDTPVRRVAAPKFVVKGDWTGGVVPIPKLPVGPYRVVWTLSDPSGGVMETRREELLIIGPLPQDKIPLASFEQKLEARLKRVIHIDCTQPAKTSDRFLDTNGSELDKSRVVTVNGLTYRETGPDFNSQLNYRLQDPNSSKPTLTRGHPYIVEVVVPDDRERSIYSGVIETRPLNYFNNGWYNGWPAATGAARMGGIYPNSGGWRKLRYIYYPSSASAAVMVINTMYHVPAAVREINIYKVNGGLPALDMPVSSRGVGPHDERVTLNAGSYASENPLENAQTIALNGHRDGWSHWYRIYERKINALRFQGFNMAVEGLYQYYEPSFPQKLGSWVSNDDIDLPYLAIKMYRRNGIKTYLGLEYSFDPAMAVNSATRAVSDRRMREGEPTFQAVDRYGRQVSRGMWGNANFLHPTTRKYFHGLVKEVYDRYHDAGPVEGLYLATFGWLIPGFQQGGYGAYNDLSTQDIGYDDFTAALFEKETGIKLNVDTQAPDRFAKRYALLSGRHAARWRLWRVEKVRDAYMEVSRMVRSQPEKWEVTVEASPDAPFQNPFKNPDATASQRAGAFDASSSSTDMPLALYRDLPHIKVAPLLPATGWYQRDAGANVLDNHSLLAQRETGAAVEHLKALAIGGGLDEINPPVGAAPRWIWTNGTAGVYIPRGIEDNAMNDFVEVVKNGVPETIIYSWLDVNVESAFGPQLRRFNKSFAVTPIDVKFKPLLAPQVRGVIAQTALRQEGGVYLRLINNSPYTLIGSLASTATEVKDLVYDANLKGKMEGSTRKYSLKLLPNDICIFTLNEAQVSKLSFDFDAATTSKLWTQAKALLDDEKLRAAIPNAKRASLQSALTSRDAWAAYNLLNDWEVLSATSKAGQPPR